MGSERKRKDSNKTKFGGSSPIGRSNNPRAREFGIEPWYVVFKISFQNLTQGLILGRAYYWREFTFGISHYYFSLSLLEFAA